MNILFYDGSCGLCHRAIQFLLKADKKKIFLFAPLQGQTATQLLQEEKKEINSLVLLETDPKTNQKKVYNQSRGFFRIFWLLGRWWTSLGIFSFFPSFLFDWAYKWVANRRYRWFERTDCLIPMSSDKMRFLP